MSVTIQSDTPRFAVLRREDLDETGRAVWDHRTHLVNAPTGHFNVLLHTPPLCRLVHDLEAYFRSESSISTRDRELMTLAIVREANARFAWGRHEAKAMECGVSREIVEGLRSRSPLESFPAEDRLVVGLARALSGARQELPQDLFDRAMKERGQRWTVEAIALAGHYTMVAVLIHGFGVVPRMSDGGTF